MLVKKKYRGSYAHIQYGEGGSLENAKQKNMWKGYSDDYKLISS